jgi:hypothetical protein
MSENPRNKALHELYCRHWDVYRQIIDNDPDLSMPFFAAVHPDFEKSSVRLVVVGKETNGWANEMRSELLASSSQQAVKSLMEQYQEFELGRRYSGKASFWVPIHELYRQLDPGGPELGFVSLNVTKVEKGGAAPNAAIRDLQFQTRMLAEEIKLLDPHLVVFHTGPYYEKWLSGWFPDLVVKGDEWLATLSGGGLPVNSYRTYHPRYLNYKSRRKEIYSRIEVEFRRNSKLR